VPNIEPSQIDGATAAQTAIGQRDVRVTPLQMAVVAGAIGQGGVVYAPRLVQSYQDFAGSEIRRFEPAQVSQAISPATAAVLRQAMVSVVAQGTGRQAQIPGVEVAGKTGTAQRGEGQNPNVWFVGFAPANSPRVAVAVVVEDGGNVGSEATGGAVAAPIARSVIQAALARP
jgi:peptidoglycan glycosyltransferase